MSNQRLPETDRRTVLKSAGAIGAFVGVGAVGSASASGETKELVVKKDDLVGIADVESAVERALPANADIIHKNEVLGYVTVEVPIPEVGTMDDAVATIENQAGVAFAEENIEFHTLETASNDPYFPSQYTPQQVDAPEAWNTTQAEDVVLSVIDQGVDYEHENLHDRFGSNVGYDFVDNNNDPMPVSPRENHGTHVAGIAAATTNNGVGTSGISNAQILSARALGDGGGGSLQDIADAIQWSADQNADVINMSLGGGGRTNLMENAVNYAFDNGTLPIAAAGNDGGPVNFPAAYDNCLAVSAIDENGNAASFTSRGPRVDVTAGGVDVLSTDNNNGYTGMSGTSMSSPVVAGVACLGASAHGLTGSNQDPGQLWGLLTETAVPVQGLPSDVEGDGLVNAANLVDGGSEPEPPEPPEGPEAVIDASDTTPEVGETVDLDGSASEGDITEYAWDANPGGEATGEQVQLQRDEEVAVDVTLTVTDTAGETDSTTKTIDFGGDGEPNQPTAVIDASDTEPDVGDTVDLDGTGSESPNGEIVEYAWDADPGGEATGEQVMLERDEEIDIDVTLTVTDEAGETGADTVTISFGGDEQPPEDPVCGDETNTQTESGSLNGGWWGDTDNYTYDVSTSNPCDATVTLRSDADFDLLVTTDVRTPSTWDYDAASTGPSATEEVTVDLEDVENLGILVRASYFTSGSYEVEIEERGK